jgi:hypothetical protein
MGKFPVQFQPLYMGESVKDESEEFTNELSKNFTNLVKTVISWLNQGSIDQSLLALKHLILRVGPRGIHSIFGFRKTAGS